MAPREGSADGSRRRNNSRRRKIRAELEAKQLNSKDAWALQQQLLTPGATEALMQAAKALLQQEHYEAVVEERALEGSCGYPPCTGAAAILPEGKRWSVNFAERKVYNAKEITRFCCSECRRANSAFILSLLPEPAYIRPASAVAASRSAVADAEANKACLALSGQCNAPTCDATESADAPDASAQQQKPIPKVRQRAVVRFSRERQTYSVQYTDYDGGGNLPDVCPACTSMPVAPSIEGKAGVSALLKAPVLEREPQAAASDSAPPKDVKSCAESLDPELAKEEVKDAEQQQQQQEIPGNSDSDGEGDGFTQEDTVPDSRSQVPFVRAWGVLNCWLTDPALQVLRGASPQRVSEERRPGHKGRRDLLCELLSSRLPGEVAFLGSRFYELASCLGVHQTLPSVTENNLYDLLAALLLQGLLRVEIQRGVCDLDPFQAAVLERRVKVAAEALGISESEQLILMKMVS